MTLFSQGVARTTGMDEVTERKTNLYRACRCLGEAAAEGFVVEAIVGHQFYGDGLVYRLGQTVVVDGLACLVEIDHRHEELLVAYLRAWEGVGRYQGEGVGDGFVGDNLGHDVFDGDIGCYRDDLEVASVVAIPNGLHLLLRAGKGADDDGTKRGDFPACGGIGSSFGRSFRHGSSRYFVGNFGRQPFFRRYSQP